MTDAGLVGVSIHFFPPPDLRICHSRLTILPQHGPAPSELTCHTDDIISPWRSLKF